MPTTPFNGNCINNNDIVRAKKHEAVTSRGQSIRLAVCCASATLLQKLISVFISLITLPLGIDYLGKERYGEALAALSLSSLFLIDAGLSESLKIQLVSSFTKKEGAESKTLIQTTWILLLAFTCVMAGAAAIFLSVWPLEGQAHAIYSASISITILSIPLLPLKQICAADQRGYLFSIFQTFSVVLVLLGTALAIFLNGNSIGIVLANLLPPLIANILLCVFLYFSPLKIFMPRCLGFDYKKMKLLLGKAVPLFFFSISHLVIYLGDPFFLNLTLPNEKITDYVLSLRLFLYAESFLQIFLYPLWGLLGKRIAMGDNKWARSSSMSLLFFVGIGSLIFYPILAAFSPALIELWTKQIILTERIDFFFIVGWFVLRAMNAVFNTVMRGYGKIHIQSLAMPVEAFLHVILIITLTPLYGLTGAYFGVFMSAALVSCVTIPFHSYLLIFKS
jgi:O-antigen/teichoic acid export membrane protein